jgi:hypothetical protein
MNAIDPHTVWLADRRLWQNLEGDRWITRDERNPHADDEMTDEVLRILNQPIRDVGAAGYRIRSLLASGFLKVRKLGDGGLEFTRVATCPDPPEPVDWAEKMNAEIRRGQAAERERMKFEAEQAERHARFLNGPSQAEQIVDLVKAQVAQQIAIQLPGAVRTALREQAALETTFAPVEAGAFERHSGAVITSADIGSAEQE